MAQANNALLVIDMQKGFDDPSWGVRNNPHAEANGMKVLNHWRALARPVFIVRHDSLSPESSLRPGQAGNDLKPGFAPAGDDRLVTKHVNSAFIGTYLETQLRRAGMTAVTLFGLTTDQCVSTTARMASNLGFATTLVEDACACFAQTSFHGDVVSADVLHMAHVTTLLTEFARVVTTEDVLRS